jgi:hypothetical protein
MSALCQKQTCALNGYLAVSRFWQLRKIRSSPPVGAPLPSVEGCADNRYHRPSKPKRTHQDCTTINNEARSDKSVVHSDTPVARNCRLVRAALVLPRHSQRVVSATHVP